ncbi:MAG: T9SS type A sorting domain-containing protein [Bacteroidota bacterium]
MKLKVLLISILFFNLNINAQSMPCVPGLDVIYSIDLDNDGYTQFDINYFIQYNLRPNLESYYNVSSSGYNITFYNSNNILSGSPYTNIVINEACSLKIEYSGTGSIFVNPPNSCYTDPNLSYHGVELMAVRFDSDNDNDGVSNRNEDTNNNLNLMDDDEDNDGIINLLDPVALSTDTFESPVLRIFPNPISNGIINLDSNFPIKEVILYDLTGKTLLNESLSSNKIDVSKIASGTYLLKLKSNEKVFNQKIIIN